MPDRKRGRTFYGNTARKRPVRAIRPRVRRPRIHPARRRRKLARRIKNNLEVKTQTHAVRVDELGFHGGTVHVGPSNSLVLLAGLFGGHDSVTPADTTTGLIPGNGCEDVIGCYTTPAYPSSMKLDISYKELQVVAGSSFPNPNLRIIHGFYKNTGDKIGADLTSNSTWINAIRITLLKELFDSDYDSDYLAYTQKSRNIKILSDRLIRPRKATAVQLPLGTEPGEFISAILAPNSQLSYKWPHSKYKTKLVGTVDTSAFTNTRMVPHNAWVPFLLALAPGIATAGHGHLRVRSVTKAYFNDA